MTEIEKIKKEINDINEIYTKNAIYIIQDYNSENKTRDDYKGRQIFELLQNADDCYTEDTPNIKVEIQLNGKYLIFKNNGSPFNARGIASIMHSDTSSKKENTIGCKGLGFRSVLNWSKEFFIITHEFVVNFSEKRAKDNLEKIKLSNKNISHFDELNNLERTSILSTAEIVNDHDLIQKYLNNGFSTAIVLECDKDVLPIIQNELCDFKFEELIFLNHINEISIESPKSNRKIVVEKSGENFTIKENETSTCWQVWKKTGSLSVSNQQTRNYEIALAYSKDENSRNDLRNNGVLYSYFKTDIPMPFPFLVHGTFDLTSERNNLEKDNEANKKILAILIDFIVEKGVEIASTDNKPSSYEALKFLLPNKDIYILDSTYNFTNQLKEKIKKYKILPSIDESYLSFDDSPKFDCLKFANYCKKERFHNLLKYCEDKRIIEFIKDENNVNFYSESELTDLINQDADYYIENKSASELIFLYNEKYRNATDGPNILYDENNKRIDKSKKAFNNPTANTISTELPSWSSLSYINNELQKELSKKWGECTVRELTNNLRKFGCDEYSFDGVLRELINQSKNHKDNTNDLLKWLYEYWKNNNNKFDSSLANIDIHVVDKNEKIIKASQCYLDEDYDNIIGQNILKHINNVSFLSSMKDIGIKDEDEKESFKNFLKVLNISEFPKIIKKEITDEKEIKEYCEYNKKKYSKLVIDKKESYNYDELSDKVNKINILTIDNLDTIFNESKFEDILLWILKDRNLYNRLTNDNEDSEFSCMIVKPIRKKEVRKVNSSYMRSYLKKRFSEIEWINTKSNRKVNSESCILTSDNLSPIVESPNVDYVYLEDKLGYNAKRDVESFFEKLGVANDIKQLSKQKIYEILLKLPDIDTDYTIGKKVYAELNLSFNSEEVENLINDNEMYIEFKNEGKVLVQVDKQLKYIKNTEAYYVENKILSDDVLERFPRLVLNRRAGEKKIISMFCVKSIKDDVKIEITEQIAHNLNEKYQNEFNEILPYIYAKRIQYDKSGAELNKLKKNKIVLVSSAKTSIMRNDEQEEGILNNYDNISFGDTAYVKIPDEIIDISQLKNEIKFISAIAEIITTIIDVNNDKDAFINILSRKSVEEIEEYYRQNGDDYLQNIQLAKEKFNQKKNIEDEFIKALVSATGKEKNEIVEILADYSIDYLNLNNDKNYKHIIKLFKTLEIDICDYNKYAYEKISLLNYFNNQFYNLKSEYREKYYSYILKNIIENKGSKSEFEVFERKYDDTDNIIKDNSIYVEIKDIYAETYGVYIKDLEKVTEDYKELLKLLEPSTSVENSQHEEQSKENKNDSSNKNIINYKEINKKIANGTSGKIDSPDLTSEFKIETGHQKNSRHSKTYNERNNEIKELIGFIAESKVFNTLSKKEDIENVSWRSSNAEKSGECEKGDDTLGYDIFYRDKENKEHFVEVKGSKSNNIEFHLTKNEYDCARNKKEKYEIWFVNVDENNEPSDPKKLGNIFTFKDGENYFDYSKFRIENEVFKIRTQIDNKKV